jgi:hypothetical protein
MKPPSQRTTEPNTTGKYNDENKDNDGTGDNASSKRSTNTSQVQNDHEQPQVRTDKVKKFG